jgi:chemotaxis signal transduction protein
MACSTSFSVSSTAIAWTRRLALALVFGPTCVVAGVLLGLGCCSVASVSRPCCVLGIINLRGNVVTVIDTRQRFGLKSSDVTENTRIVIIEVESHIVGIMVDAVAEVVYLSQSDIEKAPNVGTEDNSKFIQGVCNIEDQLLILVDLDKLLTDDEWSDVDDS